MTLLKKNLFYFSIISLILFSTQFIYSISVIPNEIGFGMNTPAGRGGEAYVITNLNPSGEGSLKECIDANGPRICVFEVSGTIFITKNLIISNPHITIAGQTAPTPGITIAGASLNIESHDVLVQHIKVRVGDNEKGPDPESRDAIIIGSNSNDVYNVIVDHISASWSIDEIISTWSDKKSIYNISIQNSIFSEALFDSIHPEGKHSMGVLIGKNTENLIFKNNLMAYNSARNPLIRDDSTNIIIMNNFIFGSSTSSKNKICFGSHGRKNIPLRASVIGNIYLNKNDDGFQNIIYIEEDTPSDTLIYLKDNLIKSSNKINNDSWAEVLGRKDNSIHSNSPPIWIDGLNLKSAKNVKESILINAGARPQDRDNIDKRVISNIKNMTGKIINSQNEVGGWQIMPQNTRKLILPLNPNKDDDNNGYTNMEEWLYLYSNNVEFGTNITWIQKDIIDDIDNKSSNISNEQIDKIQTKWQKLSEETYKIKLLYFYLFLIITIIIIILVHFVIEIRTKYL